MTGEVYPTEASMGPTKAKAEGNVEKMCVKCKKITSHRRMLRNAVGLEKRVLVCNECGRQTKE